MIRRTLTTLTFLALASQASAQTPAAPPRTGAPAQPGAGAAAEGNVPQLPPLPAHLQNAPTPKSPSPGIALASFGEGRIYLRSVLPIPKPGTPAPAAGAMPSELASVAEPFDVKQIQARTANGQAIAAADLQGRLAREIPVVVGLATMPPDPTYLKALKDDTIVLLISPPQGPAPGQPGAAPAGGAAPASGAPARPAGTPR